MSRHYEQSINENPWHPRTTYNHHHIEEEAVDDFSRLFEESRQHSLTASQHSCYSSPWPCYLTDQQNGPSQMSNINTNFNPSRPMNHYAANSNIPPTHTMLSASDNPFRPMNHYAANSNKPSTYTMLLASDNLSRTMNHYEANSNTSPTYTMLSASDNPSRPMNHYAAYSKTQPTYTMLSTSDNPSRPMDYYAANSNTPPMSTMLSVSDNLFRPMNHYAANSNTPTTSTMLSVSDNPDVTTTVAPTPSLIETTQSCKRKQKRYRTPLQESSEKGTTNIKSRRDVPSLRNFSKKVMEKIKEKKIISFDEIADEMFTELSNSGKDAGAVNKECIMKNIRRRVYDILNVLVALEMVSKDKKKFTWIEEVSDIPGEQHSLQQEKKELEESIQQKTADLQQLILSQIAYKNLLDSKKGSNPQQCALASRKTIDLPFIAVRTSKNTVISHATSKDKLEHVFKFDQPFQIHDNMEVLMRMGMAFGLETNTCSKKNLGISRTMVSKELCPYLEEMGKFGHIAKTGSKFQ